jgi:hypothetical protein
MKINMEANKIGNFYVGNIKKFTHIPGPEAGQFASNIYYHKLERTGRTVVVTEYYDFEDITATKQIFDKNGTLKFETLLLNNGKMTILKNPSSIKNIIEPLTKDAKEFLQGIPQKLGEIFNIPSNKIVPPKKNEKTYHIWIEPN